MSDSPPTPSSCPYPSSPGHQISPSWCYASTVRGSQQQDLIIDVGHAISEGVNNFKLAGIAGIGFVLLNGVHLKAKFSCLCNRYENEFAGGELSLGVGLVWISSLSAA
jgi:hypothetical protein